MVRRYLAWIARLGSNKISLLGLVLTSVSGSFLLLVLSAELVSPSGNPYSRTILLLFMPFLFVVGLILIPIGLFLESRRRRKYGPEDDSHASLRSGLTLLLQNPIALRSLLFVAAATVVNIALIGGAGQQAMSFMDSPRFCGETCHSVMEPEYASYQRSPHAHVECVVCHIGDSASWIIKAKIDGLRQCWRTLTDTWERPIKTPVHSLRPARETCEKCHWPATFIGNQLVAHTHYEEDEENTAAVNVLLLRIGGRRPETGRYEGIHWHVSPENRVTYEALDDRREKIGKITVSRGGKVVREYFPPEGVSGEVVETRTMDCVDCHNRPTHIFDATPALALDRGFEKGILDASTPYLRALALALLQREDRSHGEELEKSFARELQAAYSREHPQVELKPEAIGKAAEGLALLYRENIFPERKVGWGTYPNHLGHRGGPPADLGGCFRCHNEDHKTRDGQEMGQDCDLCHTLLAEEEDPQELDDYLKVILFGDE